MFKRIIKNPLFWIFVLAFVLRIYKLNIFPYGFHVDEVKVGWNALSILQTGRDDHNNLLSLYYNTFGDYRPTGIFYTTIPSIALFGKTEFAIRFPSAFFGALTIFALYYLVYEITQKRKTSLLAAFLITISPWHIETSRATSEVVISTFFAIFGLYFFIKLLKKSESKFAIYSVISFLISYLLYHSTRILAPIFIFTASFYYLRSIKKIISNKFVFIVFAGISIASILLGTSKDAGERFKQVSFLKDPDLIYEVERITSENKRVTIASRLFDNKGTIYLRKIADEYTKYFSPDFLIGNSARPFRYTTPGVGLLTYIEFILLGIGLIAIFQKKYSALPLILLLLAPLTAAITLEDSPNLHRAFFMLPFLIIIESYGINYLLEIKKYKRLISLTVFSLLLLNFVFFLHMYFNHSMSHKPFMKDLFVDSPTYRNIGAKELVLKIDQVKGNYDKIVITNFPDNLYPWYAFLTYKDPKTFNQSILKGSNEVIYKNIVFSDTKCPSDYAFDKFSDKKLLIVDNWECASESKIKGGLRAKIIDEIVRPDGSLVYTLLERN